ncbi:MULTISPECIES: zinc-binding dehydrogenase [unclassified Streptomyces]|uniref:quinone oxidoreductase family protein n=1 Tax=unclassified Streptomyces TaxID=2593676 RepID=UPI00224E8CA5|nr:MULTISPECIES: zinc-binding dehydrogenase [unclassified Streptomyces]MCX5332292.1 zinc-binding dehydrogenase [Streptomyces sp. NBC_00140]MCX5361669.1 zinc-binding dehydrogenase [Streptomyces sp. NBC_00124]
MRAVEIQEYGGPEVLKAVEAEVPGPGPGQVSIDVAYAGINFADLKARESGYRVPGLPFVPGLEVSGRVRAVGEGVSDLTVSQEVTALTAGGGYADVAVADAATVFPLPAGIDLRTAATLPTVVPTAYALIHAVGRLQPGETVLVQGAAGGIGTVVGQLAKAAGGRVFGVVSSAAKAAYAREYGYDEVFVGDFEAPVREATGGRGVDLALDPVGGDTFRSSLAALAVYGRLVSFGNASGAAAWSVGQPELYPSGVSVGGFSILTLAQTAPDELRALTERAFAKVADGTVTLPVTAEFGLAGAAEAHRLMGTRSSTGKLLLKVDGR